MDATPQKKKSSIPDLSKSAINLDKLRIDAYLALEKIISEAGGIGVKNKAMIFDPDLTASINLMIPISTLRTLGVVSFYYLEETNIKTDAVYLIYIIRPEFMSCKRITEHILSNNKLGLKKNYYIVFLPKTNIQCNRVFECAGIWSNVKIFELPIRLVPLDYDLLSMEYLGAFRSVMLDRYDLPLFTITESLINLQEKFGLIPCIQGIGSQSRFVIEELIRQRTDQEYSYSSKYMCMANTIPQIGRMIIIDRECDFVSPLLTQLIYGGLIDETIGIKDNTINISVPVEKKTNTSIKTEKDKNITVRLDSTDPVYELLRDTGVSSIGTFLEGKLAEYSIVYKKLNQEKNNTNIAGLARLEKQFPQNLLSTHFNIANKIISSLKEPQNIEALDIEQNLLLGIQKGLINNEIPKYKERILSILNNKTSPLNKILRICCLYCIVNDGIDLEWCSVLQHIIILKFGSKYCFIIEHLLKIGMLHPPLSQYAGSWEKLKKDFLLLPDQDNNDPNDISFIFGGYAPLSCRIIEYALTIPLRMLIRKQKKDILYNGWIDRSISKKMQKVSDTVFNVVQNINLKYLDEEQITSMGSVVLVFFIGGITYAEISALRFITKINPGKHIIIATTKVINGNNFIESLY